MTRDFPFNPLFAGITFKNNELTLLLKKKTGIQVRKYIGVPAEIGSKMFYLNQPKEIMSYYSTKIKNQFKVIVK